MPDRPPPTSIGGVSDVLGPTFTDRGRRYARDGMVRSASWDPDATTLVGQVHGSGSRIYTTTAEWARRRGSWVLLGGDCSCPMVGDCKHVAALVLAADRGLVELAPRNGEAALGGLAVDGDHHESSDHSAHPVAGGVGTGAEQAPWRTLLSPTTSSAWHRDRDTAPLGLQFTLRRPTTRTTSLPASLSVRLIQPGRTGWTAGTLDWRTLSEWSGGYGRSGPTVFDTEQVRVAKALYAMSTALATYGSYTTSVRDLDLTEFAHPQLWTLLQAAVDAGMPLRTGRSGAAAVDLSPVAAEVRLDLTRPDGPSGGLVATPGLWLDDRTVDPILFVGKPAHGVVLARNAPGDPVEGGAKPEEPSAPMQPLTDSPHDAGQASNEDAPGLWLAPLNATPPAGLVDALQADEAIPIPAAEEATFVAEGWTRLRRQTHVTSSDGSFIPPTITGPELVARVVPEHADRLQIHWGVRYRIDDESREDLIDADLDVTPWRDPAAEAKAIGALASVTGTGSLGQADFDAPLGLLDAAGALRPSAIVTGEAAIDLATRLLPELEEHPDVIVEVEGTLPDYRDVTDVVQVEVATRAFEDNRDWFGLDVELKVDGRTVPLGAVFTALTEGRTRLMLRDGAWMSLDRPVFDQLRVLIEEAEGLTEPTAKGLSISRYQADLWEQLAALGIVTGQAAAWKRQVEGLLADPSVRQLDPPPGLQATLRPYQQEGFSWLAFLAEHQLGGILADDMGLGKTVQTLAMILHQRRGEMSSGMSSELSAAEGPGGGAGAADGPFLVVAPASVVHGCVSEAARFTPDLDVLVADATFAKMGTTAEELAAEADVVITSYTRFRLDAEEYRRVRWAGLVLDEAQAVKNHRSKVYGCVRRLGAPTCIAITGTPMENNLMELWSLLSVAAPGLYPNPSRFKEQWATPIQRSGDIERLALLRRRIRPLLLRRTKEEVAPDLPPKQEQILDVTLTPAHRKVYDTWLQRERRKVLGLMGDLDEHRFTVLRSITLLRLASLHAGLVEEAKAGVASAKLDVLVEHLTEIAEAGHRALVFSQFTSFLALVRERLEQAGLAHAYLDGSTRRRDRVVEAWKTSAEPVFIISLKAGGVGLNLTEADYVFLLDPWWNPATEAQAIDRTHRIGQTRPVMVYRLIAEDTIEQKVRRLAERKAELVEGVMAGGPAFDGKLTAEDVEALFG
ncbi:DEAD/DEAH box helicase [Euzebya tangerina]|uniref:DEAD/DEAH box helicase n=1 Tax=Euzebya tangerina TaxID=591198 RepID=UPI002F30B834